MLLVLLAASALVFVIACSNVANLILARSVRREGELAVRAALGARAGALRRTLLAESLVLCGTGAVLGVLIARPMVAVLARYAARFSVRALDVTRRRQPAVGRRRPRAARRSAARVRSAAAVGRRVERVRSLERQRCASPAGTNRRLRVFAVTQIAASFVLLAGAGMLLHDAAGAAGRADPGFDTRNVLARQRAGDVVRTDAGADASASITKSLRRIAALPGVERVAFGSTVPWRDAGSFGAGFQFSVEGLRQGDGEEDPRGALPLGVARLLRRARRAALAGRDFTDADRRGAERVVIVSAEPRAAAVPEPGRRQPPPDRGPIRSMKFIGVSTEPRRIVGVVADIDDENIVPGPVDDGLPPVRAGDSAAAACSCTRRPIRTRWCRRSRASCASSPPISRWSGPRRSTTSAPKCWRPIG